MAFSTEKTASKFRKANITILKTNTILITNKQIFCFKMLQLEKINFAHNANFLSVTIELPSGQNISPWLGASV